MYYSKFKIQNHVVVGIAVYKLILSFVNLKESWGCKVYHCSLIVTGIFAYYWQFGIAIEGLLPSITHACEEWFCRQPQPALCHQFLCWGHFRKYNICIKRWHIYCYRHHPNWVTLFYGNTTGSLEGLVTHCPYAFPLWEMSCLKQVSKKQSLSWGFGEVKKKSRGWVGLEKLED